MSWGSAALHGTADAAPSAGGARSGGVVEADVDDVYTGQPLDALQFPLCVRPHTGFPAGAAPQQHYTSLLFDLCKIEEPCDTFSFFFFSPISTY